MHMDLDPTVTPRGVARVPKIVDVSLTGRCNLQCRYCFFADSMATLADLPTASWLAFFEELGELAVPRVTLSGGEVFTRPDLFQLLDGIIAAKMRYSLLTNGTLITEQVIHRFEEGKRRLRLDSIQVSIDGSCAEIHNRSRPPDSFDRALKGLKLLKAKGFPVTVRVTVNRHNLDDLANIARLLLEDIGLSEFSTNEAAFMGAARCNGQEVVLTPTERRQAAAVLVALNEKYEGRISADAGPLAAARMFSDIEARLARGETHMPGRGTLCSCAGSSARWRSSTTARWSPATCSPPWSWGGWAKIPCARPGSITQPSTPCEPVGRSPSARSPPAGTALTPGSVRAAVQRR